MLEYESESTYFAYGRDVEWYFLWGTDPYELTKVKCKNKTDAKKRFYKAIKSLNEITINEIIQR